MPNPTGRASTHPSFGPRSRGLSAVLIAALLWSTGGLLIKWVSTDAFAITMWRSFFAAITIALLARPRWSSLRRELWLASALVLSYASMLLFFVIATRLTTAANAIFLQYTAPFYVVVLGWVFFRERTTRLDVATLIFAFAGMALFFVGQLRPADGMGNLIAILSGLGFACFLVLLRHPRANPDLRAATMVAGNVLLVVAIAGWFLVRGQGAPFHPTLRDLSALAFLGVVQIGLAYVIFGYGIARVSSLEASLLAMLEPILNPIWVFLVLAERPSRFALLGGGAIVLTLFVRTLAGDRRPPASRPARARCMMRRDPTHPASPPRGHGSQDG